MKKQKAGGSGPIIALVIGGVALLGLLFYGASQSTKQAEQQKKVQEMTKPNQYGCTPEPVHLEMPGLERVPCKSASHVPDTQKVKYATDPPTSGDHYGVPTAPGFYTAAQTPERLVHSLEHGNVVIYYNQAKLSDQELEAIRSVAKQFTGGWDGVVAVPRSDPTSAVILTAWEHALRLDKYEKAKVDQFVDAFRGRGPENPVRPLQ